MITKNNKPEPSDQFNPYEPEFHPQSCLLWMVAGVLIWLAIILFCCSCSPDTSRKVSGMHYRKIDGRLVNVTVDSLECQLLQMEIEKQKRNVIFEYKTHKP